MEYHKEVSKKVQLTGTMLVTRAWPVKLESGEMKEDVPFSTRKMDIFAACSGEKFRYDITQTFPGRKDSTAVRTIIEPGKWTQAVGLELGNPTVFIKKLRGGFTWVQLLFVSHYSLSFRPLTEVIQSENYTYQIVREETYNGSKCLVLHGQVTAVGLEKANLPPATNSTVDIWLDTQKDLAVVQTRYFVENRDYIETVIELGKYNGFWFPKKVRRKEYELTDGKKELIEDVSLEAHEVTIGQRVAPSLFTLDGLNLPPRTTVVDKINGIEFVLEKKRK